jgi:hypothetical protein
LIAALAGVVAKVKIEIARDVPTAGPPASAEVKNSSQSASRS